MGGRGANSGSGSAYSATSVTTQTGDVADLGANPLQYGKMDKSLSGKARTDIENFEKSRKTAKTEAVMILGSNGETLAVIKGRKGSVDLGSYARQGAIFSHNHPRGAGEEGALGGTFSKADLDIFSRYNNFQVMRASAAEGTYSIAKTENFDRAGYHQFIKKMSADTSRAHSKQLNALIQTYQSTDMTSAQLRVENMKLFNSYLVSVHNELLANQKQYGYTYTLERWNNG